MDHLRRRLLTVISSLALGSSSGCLYLVRGGDDDDSSSGSSDDEGDENGVTADEEETIIATGEGITASVRRVSHTPEENTATVEGAINVPREFDYHVRLGVIDEAGIVLAQEVNDELLYPTGTNLVSAELEVDDCEACHSGLVDVRLSESARKELEQEREEQREREQDQQEMREQQQQNESDGNESAGETVTPDESEEGDD